MKKWEEVTFVLIAIVILGVLFIKFGAGPLNDAQTTALTGSTVINTGEIELNNDAMRNYIIGGILVVILIVIFIFSLIHHKHKKAGMVQLPHVAEPSFEVNEKPIKVEKVTATVTQKKQEKLRPWGRRKNVILDNEMDLINRKLDELNRRGVKGVKNARFIYSVPNEEKVNEEVRKISKKVSETPIQESELHKLEREIVELRKKQ